MHFPVSLLKDSPTAMGLISGGLPSFSLINVPPAKNLATIGGAFPEARRFTMSLRVAHMGVAIGIRAASSKCCMRSPDGPAAVPFGKERRVDKISKPGPTEIGIVFTLGATRGGQLGCLDCSNCQVASLLGANPFDSRTLHALPNKLALPNEIA